MNGWLHFENRGVWVRADRIDSVGVETDLYLHDGTDREDALVPVRRREWRVVANVGGRERWPIVLDAFPTVEEARSRAQEIVEQLAAVCP